MKGKFKQSSIPQTSTKQTITLSSS